MLYRDIVIEAANNTFSRIHSINYNEIVFSQYIFLITDQHLNTIYLYIPFVFKQISLFDDTNFLRNEKTAFLLASMRNTLAYISGFYGKYESEQLTSIAMPFYVNGQLLGYIGMFSEKNILGMEPVIELLSKLIGDQVIKDNEKSVEKKQNMTLIEKSIIELIILGKTDLEIAAIIKFSKSTVRFHISKLFKKYKVKNRIELSNLFIQMKLRNGESYE